MTSEFAIGVHALVYLKHKKETLSSEALAENVCTNPARIRKVMAKLKKPGLVKTREGVGGGYTLGDEGKQITLGMISSAVEERFVKSSWTTGNQEMDCLVASGMAGVLDEIYGEMNGMCQEYLEKITLEDIEGMIFEKQIGTKGMVKSLSIEGENL